MDFQLNQDQRAYADTARAIFADYCSDEQLQQFDKADEPYQNDLWQQCVATGLHAMIVPEVVGGLGLGMTELMVVLQEQGAALGAVPLWEQQLAAAALATHGEPTLQSSVLGTVMAGEKILTLSLESNCAASGATLNAVEQGDGWRIGGRVAAVPFGGQADYALLSLAVGSATRLALVKLDVPGVQRISGFSQHHQAVADLAFDAVVVAADSLLSEEAFSWTEPRAIACLAALQLGVSAQQLVRTVQYVSERKQFNRPIGAFQLVVGQMADGHIAVEALRTSLYQLVHLLDTGAGALPQALATRCLACDAGHKVGHMGQHVHGGMGVDTSYAIHRFLFWSRALSAVLGGTERNLARLGDWLADHDSLGWKYDLTEDKAV